VQFVLSHRLNFRNIQLQSLLMAEAIVDSQVSKFHQGLKSPLVQRLSHQSFSSINESFI